MTLPGTSRRCIFGAGLAAGSLIFACGCLWLNSGVRQTSPEPQANFNRGLAMTIENLPGEEWRPVVGWESLYEVSNMGRIRSFPRVCWNGKVEWTMPSRIMHDYLAFKGYRYVTLNTGLKPVNRLVHQVVATAFLGVDPDRPFVNHKDGNKVNNRLDNLEWCTQKENARHAVDTGLSTCLQAVERVGMDGSVTRFRSKAEAQRSVGTRTITISRYIASGKVDHRGFKWRAA